MVEQNKTEQFKSKLLTLNQEYSLGNFEIVGEYISSATPIKVKTRYGICLMYPENLLKGGKPRLLSAEDKNEYFFNMLKEVRSDFEDLRFLSSYVNNSTPILIETEFGTCSISPSSLLNGSYVGIDSAVNKTEYFINMCKKTHGDKFSYENLTYVSSSKKVTVTCKVHGDFEQLTSDHINGSGCQKCSKGEHFSQDGKQKTHEEFLELLYKKNSAYVNGEIEILGRYEHSNKPILVKDKYGECLIAASSVLKEKLPSIFSAVNKTEYYKNRFIEANGDKYSYENFEYLGSKTKSVVTCRVHGDFLVEPPSHLFGRGCLKCANEVRGWSRTSWSKAAPGNKGIFYIIRCTGEDEEFYKIGITCLSVKHRYRNHKRMPYNYDVLVEISSDDRDKIWNLEKKIKRENRFSSYTPTTSFDGLTECFKEIRSLNKLIKNTKKPETMKGGGCGCGGK